MGATESAAGGPSARPASLRRAMLAPGSASTLAQKQTLAETNQSRYNKRQHSTIREDIYACTI